MTIYAIVAAALILTGLTDWWTTRRSLKAGNREVNPIWRWAQERFGRWWALPKMAAHIGLAGLVWYLASPLWLIVGVLVTLAIGYVVYRNYKLV